MKFLDLCAGIGGFSLGLEKAGLTCVGQVEIDDWCTKILENIGPACPAGATSPLSTPPDCRQLSLFAEDTLASLLVRPGSEEARKMTATSGRSFFPLLKQSGPLGACLRTLLGTSRWGSTVCFLTWKISATPAGRSLFRLVPSTPRTEETGSGFWHTPNVPNGGRVNPPDMSPIGRLPNGKKRQVGLEHQVRMVERNFWSTPKGSPSGPDYARMDRDGSGGDDLATAVARRELIPTPLASDADHGGPSQVDANGRPEKTAAWAAMFPTPPAANYRTGYGQTEAGLKRMEQARGKPLQDIAAPGGQLNPQWVEWLMGFPAGWTALED